MSKDARATEFAAAADRSDLPAGGCRPVIGRVQLPGEREAAAIMGDMPSSPHHPAPASKNLSGTDAEDLALYREKFRCRLPESLDELHGPTQGVVELPLHMAWSGMTSYDLGKPRQRMGLYRTVLHEGLHDDLPRYLNQDLLLQLWPVLRTLVGRTVRTVWEDAFAQLASRTQAAA